MNTLSPSENFLVKLNHRFNLFFWVSFALIAYINIYKFPALNIYGEMIGEMGNLYYYDAKFKSVWHNLTTVIAAYIPLTERILSLVVIKVLGMDHLYPWFVQGGCVILISACCALVNLSAFKKLIDDDFTRFLIAIFLGSCVYLDGMKLYNAPYIGSLFILWTILLDKEKMSRIKLGVLFIGMFIFLLGKAHYIAFLPIHAFIAYRAFKAKQKTTIIFYILIMVVQVFQLAITLSTKSKWDQSAAKLGDADVGDIIIYAFKYVYYDIAALGGLHFVKLNTLFVAVIVLGSLIWCFSKIYKSQEKKNVFFIGTSCFVVSLISIAISIKGFPDYATPAKLNEHFHFHYRHFLFSDALIIFGVCVIICGALSKEWSRMSIMGLMMIMVVGKNVFPNHNPADTPSKWEIYHKLVDEEDFFIPTWSYNSWMVAKNSRKLTEFSIKANAEGLSLNEIKKFMKKIEPSNWNVRGFMLAQQSGYQKASEPLAAVALSSKGEVLSRATSMTPPNYKFQYFRFDEFVTPAHIVLSDSKNQRKRFPAGHVMLFGQKKVTK